MAFLSSIWTRVLYIKDTVKMLVFFGKICHPFATLPPCFYKSLHGFIN